MPSMLVKQNLASKMITRIKWVLGIALILQSESGKTVFSKDIAVGTIFTIVAAQSSAPSATHTHNHFHFLTVLSTAIKEPYPQRAVTLVQLFYYWVVTYFLRVSYTLTTPLIIFQLA